MLNCCVLCPWVPWGNDWRKAAKSWALGTGAKVSLFRPFIVLLGNGTSTIYDAITELSLCNPCRWRNKLCPLWLCQLWIMHSPSPHLPQAIVRFCAKKKKKKSEICQGGRSPVVYIKYVFFLGECVQKRVTYPFFSCAFVWTVTVNVPWGPQCRCKPSHGWIRGKGYYACVSLPPVHLFQFHVVFQKKKCQNNNFPLPPLVWRPPPPPRETLDSPLPAHAWMNISTWP